LWKTDGTPEGTVLAADVAPGSPSLGPSNLTDVNGTLYFLAGPAVYRVEKANGAVNRIGTLGSTAASTGGAGGVFYVAGGWADGTALLKNDPASPPIDSGLTVVKQFAPGSAWPTDLYYAYPIVDAGGKALFMGPGTGDTNVHLWRSDGTPQGTVDLAGFPGQRFGNTGPLPTWRLEPGTNGLYYFSGREALTQDEPYRTDGTAAGTGRLIDLYTITGPSNPGPYVTLATPGGVRTVFAADDGQHGPALWVTDGTEAGTRLLNPDAKIVFDPAFSAPVNGRTFFVTRGSEGFGTRLWATDGTPAGTVVVKDFGTSLGIDYSPVTPALFAIGDKVYFIGHGTRAGDGNSGVWVSDGTAAGTRLLAPGNNPPSWLMPYGDAVYFLEGGIGSSLNLWKTDGTAAGTTLVRRLADGRLTSGFDSEVLDGVLYFIASYSPTPGSSAVALWRSDGTEAGTWVVKEVPATLEYMVAAGHRLFLACYDKPDIWTSDGTRGGTGPISDFVPALAGFTHRSYFDNPELTAAGPVVYLLGRTPSGGAGVWRTDGTPAGTRRVAALSSDVSTRAVGVADGVFYFEQTKAVGSFPDGVLWRTDGTEAGIAAVADVGAAGLGVAGDRIYFAGTDPQHRAELWSMPRGPAAGVFVRGSAWTSGFKNDLNADGLGDAAYGYRVDKGASAILPWVNVDEVVVGLAAIPPVGGAPTPGMVSFQSQRGVNYTVTRVEPVPGDARVYVFVLDKPLGGAGADSSDGDRLTLTVRGAGDGGADLTLRLSVLQGDVDQNGTVVADDASAVKSRFFKSGAAPGPAGGARYTVFHDVDGSGSILANDFSEVKKRFFHALPTATVAPALGVAGVWGRRRPGARDLLGAAPVPG
jgi:ELWxxDGT repeat protein